MRKLRVTSYNYLVLHNVGEELEVDNDGYSKVRMSLKNVGEVFVDVHAESLAATFGWEVVEMSTEESQEIAWVPRLNNLIDDIVVAAIVTTLPPIFVTMLKDILKEFIKHELTAKEKRLKQKYWIIEKITVAK